MTKNLPVKVRGVGPCGRPICIKLRKDELKRRNSGLPVIESDSNRKMSDLSPKGVPYGQSSRPQCPGTAVFGGAAQGVGTNEQLCPAQHGPLRWSRLCADVRVSLAAQCRGQLFAAPSCGGLPGHARAQSGHRRALWAGFQPPDATAVGRSGRPAGARASAGTGAVGALPRRSLLAGWHGGESAPRAEQPVARLGWPGGNQRQWAAYPGALGDAPLRLAWGLGGRGSRLRTELPRPRLSLPPTLL